MEWRGQGILLGVRRHGETSAIIEMFTAAQGRHLGVVRGGTSRKIAPHLQPVQQLHPAEHLRGGRGPGRGVHLDAETHRHDLAP